MRISRLDAKDYARTHLRGIWGAATIPFRPDGSIDEEGFRANLRHWRDDLRLDGVLVAGPMSEFWSLTIGERKRLFALTVEESHGQMLSLLAVCDCNFAETVELLRYAQGIGAPFAAVMNPRFYPPHRPSDAEVLAYLEYLCAQVELPVCLFNHELIMGYALSPEAIARAAAIPNLVGIQNAVAEPAHTARVRALCGHRIVVSDPDEANWLMNHAVHGQQALLASPHAFLFQSRGWQPIREYTRLACAGKFEAARQISIRMDPIRLAFAGAVRAVKGAAHLQELRVIKYWQDLLGQVGGLLRPPFPGIPNELTPREKEIVRDQFEAAGLPHMPAAAPCETASSRASSRAAAPCAQRSGRRKGGPATRTALSYDTARPA